MAFSVHSWCNLQTCISLLSVNTFGTREFSWLCSIKQYIVQFAINNLCYEFSILYGNFWVKLLKMLSIDFVAAHDSEYSIMLVTWRQLGTKLNPMEQRQWCSGCMLKGGAILPTHSVASVQWKDSEVIKMVILWKFKFVLTRI